MYLFELWFSLDISLGVGLLDRMVVLFSFLGSLHVSFIASAPIYIPTNCTGSFFPVSLFPASPSVFIVHRFLDDGYSDWCEVIHCSFDVHFSNN